MIDSRKFEERVQVKLKMVRARYDKEGKFFHVDKHEPTIRQMVQEEMLDEIHAMLRKLTST